MLIKQKKANKRSCSRRNIEESKLQSEYKECLGSVTHKLYKTLSRKWFNKSHCLNKSKLQSGYRGCSGRLTHNLRLGSKSRFSINHNLSNDLHLQIVIERK